MGLKRITSVGERIDALLRRYDLNDKGFELACGLASATVYKARNDGRMSAESARRIIERFPELSLAWVLFGEGEMIEDPNKDKVSVVDAINKLSASIDRLTECIISNVEKS